MPAKSPDAPPTPRLLIVSYRHFSDGSVGGLRWAGLGKYLARLGWEVHLLTGAPSARPGLTDGVNVHVALRFPTTNDLYRWLARGIRGLLGRRRAEAAATSATTVTGAAARPTGFWRRLRWEAASLLSFPDESRGWTLRTAWATRRLVRRLRPDVVISSGPPHTAHLAAALGLLGQDVPLILDLRDPWSMRVDGWRYDPVYGTDSARFLIKHLERWVFRRADSVIANTRELADVTRGQEPGIRVTWVRNGVDPERLPPAIGVPFPGMALCYVGTLYGNRDLRPILAAFRAFLDAHPDAERGGSRLRIAGVMSQERRSVLLTQLAETRLTDRVDLLGVLPRSAAIDLLQRSRVSLVLAQDQALGVPAKLYESLIATRRSLVLTEPGTANAREATELGAVVCEATDSRAIAAFLHRIWTGREPAPPPPFEAISYKSLAERMQDLLMPHLVGWPGVPRTHRQSPARARVAPPSPAPEQKRRLAVTAPLSRAGR